MKRQKKNVLAAVLALVMMIGLLPVTTFAEELTVEDVARNEWYRQNIEQELSYGNREAVLFDVVDMDADGEDDLVITYKLSNMTEGYSPWVTRAVSYKGGAKGHTGECNNLYYCEETGYHREEDYYPNRTMKDSDGTERFVAEYYASEIFGTFKSITDNRMIYKVDVNGKYVGFDNSEDGLCDCTEEEIATYEGWLATYMKTSKLAKGTIDATAANMDKYLPISGVEDEGSKVATVGITLKVGEAFGVSTENIDVLLAQTGYSYKSATPKIFFGDKVEMDSAYLTPAAGVGVYEVATGQTIDLLYVADAEWPALIEQLESGALDSKYGTEVGLVEEAEGQYYYARADKAGKASIIIEEYEVTSGRTISVKIPVTITEAGASSPSGGSPSPTPETVTPAPSIPTPPPVESEHTLPGGEEVRMVTVKGDSEVYVIGNPALIPEGSTFESVDVTSGDTYTKAAKAIQNKFGAASFVVFEMNLTDASNQAIHQLAGYINVTVPIPAGIELGEGETIRVYRLETNGKLTRLDTAVEDGQVTFATNHFSTYIFVKENAMMSPKTGDGFVMMPMVVLALAGAVVLVSKKKIA